MVVTNLLALGRKEYFFNVVNVFLYYLPLEWAKLLYHTSNKVLDPIQYTIYNVFSFNQMCSYFSVYLNTDLQLGYQVCRNQRQRIHPSL